MSSPQNASAPDPWIKCFDEHEMIMHGSDFEHYVQRYLIPCLVIVGILGNTLNLTVLLNRKTRSRPNTFLAALAIADIIFLSLLIPNFLANYDFFGFNYYFRVIYFNIKVHIIAFANWASAVALWCVIAVCADRLIGIKNPFYARVAFSTRKMLLIFGSIVSFSGLLILYQHFAYKCKIGIFCNGTQVMSRCLPITERIWFRNEPSNPYLDKWPAKVVEINTIASVMLGIIFPIILLSTLASQLFLVNDRDSMKTAADVQASHHQKTENRVTLTVAMIVTMFTVTNGPSALAHLLKILNEGGQKDWYNLIFACSVLVIFGKASNFMLFCLSSKHFRIQLLDLVRKKVNDRLGSINEAHKGSALSGGRNRASSTVISLLPTETFELTNKKRSSSTSQQRLLVEQVQNLQNGTANHDKSTSV